MNVPAVPARYRTRPVPPGFRLAWLREHAPWRAYEWDESKHPREPAGSEISGQFAPAPGGAGLVLALGQALPRWRTRGYAGSLDAAARDAEPPIPARTTDYARIARTLDGLEADATARLRQALDGFRHKLEDLVRRRHTTGLLDAKLVDSLEVRANLLPTMRQFLATAFREGQLAVQRELGEARRHAASRLAWRAYGVVGRYAAGAGPEEAA